MKATPFLAALGALALAACGDTETASEDSATANAGLDSAEVAERARDAIRPEAGRYRATMELVDVDMPGAPQGAIDMMRGMMAGQTHEYCLTQEEVERGYEEMARQSQDGECRYQRFDVEDGAIDAAMTCSGNGEGEMRMTMKGTASSTSMDMDMTMTGNMTGMGDATLRMKASHRRIGECS